MGFKELCLVVLLAYAFHDVQSLTKAEKSVSKDVIKKDSLEEVTDDEKTIDGTPNGRDSEMEKLFNSEIDEKLIRKAEIAANKDLLGGLNIILKNHETFEDVLRKENVGNLF